VGLRARALQIRLVWLRASAPKQANLAEGRVLLYKAVSVNNLRFTRRCTGCVRRLRTFRPPPVVVYSRGRDRKVSAR
jgi:hypothetical protein